MKTSALNSLDSGLMYRGSIVLRQRANGTRVFESAPSVTGQEDQTDFNLPYTDFGARHYSPVLRRWLSPDPMSEDYYGISPYAFCNNNPVNLVDMDGMEIDDYYFSFDGRYLRKESNEQEERIIVIDGNDNSNIIIHFADPIHDPESINSNTRLIVHTYETISSILEDSGATDPNNHGLIKGSLFLKNHSDSSKNDGALDFVVSQSIIFKENALYITQTDKDGYIAHNKYNYGNFLWGAAAKALGVPQSIAKLGAHVNNFFDRHYLGKLDSKDDQFSISVGYNWK